MGNLIPNSERTPEELREMGRKGGIKSGESRRRKRELLKGGKLWLDAFNELEKKNPDRYQEIMKELVKLRKL